MHSPRRPESYAAPRLRPALTLLALLLVSASAWSQTPAPQPPASAQAISTNKVPQSASLPEPPGIPLLPGLVPDQDADGLLSFHGLPSTENNTLLDGATLTNSYNSVPAGTGADPAPDPDADSDAAEQVTGPTHGLSRGRHSGAAYTFSQASIREFRLTTDDYSAQRGHAGGTVAHAETRSGEPIFHGTLFFNLRSSALAATEPLAIATTFANGVATSVPVKPHDLRERFGGTVGGPLAPPAHRLFGFYTFDAQRRGFPAISSPADPNFYTLTPTQHAVLLTRGVSTAAANQVLTSLSALTGPVDRRADQDLHFARIDWLQHPRFNLALQFNRVRWTSPAGLTEAPVVARGRASLGNASGSVDQVLLRANTVVSPGLLNQAHIAWLRDLQLETPQTPLPGEPAIAPGGLAPEVVIGPNGLLFGTPASLSQQALPDERRIELADTLTLVRGRNTLAVGGGVAFIHDRVATEENAAGTFHYDSATASHGAAGGLVDFITDSVFNVNVIPNGGCPGINATVHLFCFQSFTQSFGVQRTAFSTEEYGAFAEDTWHPRPRLTVHLGLRYEYTLLPLPVAPNPSLDAIFGTRGATSIFPEDRNNFAPRAAFSWQVAGFNVRAGYGIFAGRLPGATLRAALADTLEPSSTSRIRIRPSAELPCPQQANQGFGYPCAFLTAPASTTLASTSAFVFDRRFRLPLVQQGNLTLERAFSRRTLLTAGYAINLDRQLAGSTDLNIAPSTSSATFQLQGGTGAPGVRDGETFSLPLYTTRISPAFGPVTAITSHSNGTYHALVLTASAEPLPTLLVRAEYTWSKAIDNAPSLSGTPRTDTQLDPYLNGYDKGLSALNQPWATRASASWRPRLHTERRHLARLANGYVLLPSLAAHAGRPASLDLFGGPALAGGHESLNGSGGALYLPTVGRNTLRLPATVTLDLRLAREFRTSDHTRLRLAADATNLLNHRNISSVNQRAYLLGTAVAGVTPLVFQSAATIAAEGLNTTPFNTPNAASSETARARQVQFGLNFSF